MNPKEGISRRDALKIIMTTVAGGFLATCEGAVKAVTPGSKQPTLSPSPGPNSTEVPLVVTPARIETPILQQPTVEPTPTELMGKIPETDADFNFAAGGSQDQIEQAINKNGGAETLKAQKDFYTAVLTEQEKQIQMRITLGEKGLDHINVNAFNFDYAFAEWSDAQNQPHFSWEVLPQSNGAYWYVQERRAQIDAQGNPVLDTQKDPVYDYVTESNGNALRVYNNPPENYRLIAGVSPEGVGPLKEVITPSKEGWFWVGYYDKAGKCLFLKDLANDKNNPTSFFRPPDSAVALVREEPTGKEWQALDINGQVLYTYYPNKQEWTKEVEDKWIEVKEEGKYGWAYNSKELLEGAITLTSDESVLEAHYKMVLRSLYNFNNLLGNKDYFLSLGIKNEDKFVEYAKTKPIKGLIIPGAYRSARDNCEATAIKVDENIDLSTILVSAIYKDELLIKYPPLLNKSNNAVSFYTDDGRAVVFVETSGVFIQPNGVKRLKYVYSSYTEEDATSQGYFAVKKGKTSEELATAVSQNHNFFMDKIMGVYVTFNSKNVACLTCVHSGNFASKLKYWAEKYQLFVAN